MEREKMIGEIEKCIKNGQYAKGQEVAGKAIEKMPKSPVFYNLMGVLLEKEYHHVQAMQYFRKAYELNHGYEPARYNLEQYGMFCPLKNYMYSDEEKEIQKRRT